MKIEDFKEITKNILENATDTGKVSEYLNTLNEDYVKTSTTVQGLIEKAEKLKNDNESLRSANMKLFLKVGEESKNEKNEGENNKNDENTEEEVLNDNLSFESLFDESGKLK